MPVVLINMTVLFLSFKQATTVPKKLINSQCYKQLRRKTLTTFQLLSHFTLTNTVKSFILKTLNYSKTIQRLVQFFHNLHKCFWLEVHFKPMTNLELSNAHTYNAKLVLSFLT